MEFLKAAKAADVTEGALVPVTPGGVKLLLTRIDGTYYAAQRKCPHLGFNLCKGKIEDHAVVCPLHKAKFDLRSGAIERDPKLLFIDLKAKSDLKTYPVKEMGEDVYIGV